MLWRHRSFNQFALIISFICRRPTRGFTTVVCVIGWQTVTTGTACYAISTPEMLLLSSTTAEGCFLNTSNFQTFTIAKNWLIGCLRHKMDDRGRSRWSKNRSPGGQLGNRCRRLPERSPQMASTAQAYILCDGFRLRRSIDYYYSDKSA